MTNSTCSNSNIYNEYNHLSLAEVACASDNHCIGIVDEFCDEAGPFRLCRDVFMTGHQTVSSCIHKKKMYNGMAFIRS